MTIALWVVGCILAYLFIGGFVAGACKETDNVPENMAIAVFLWPIVVVVGIGTELGKKVSR